MDALVWTLIQRFTVAQASSYTLCLVLLISISVSCVLLDCYVRCAAHGSLNGSACTTP